MRGGWLWKIKLITHGGKIVKQESKLLLAAEVVMVGGAIVGSLLIALNIPVSKWGYLLFLLSSMSGIYVGTKTRKSLTIMNQYFTIVNVIGVYRWFS